MTSNTPNSPERASRSRFAAYTVGGLALTQLRMFAKKDWKPFAFEGLVGAPIGAAVYGIRRLTGKIV